MENAFAEAGRNVARLIAYYQMGFCSLLLVAVFGIFYSIAGLPRLFRRARTGADKVFLFGAFVVLLIGVIGVADVFLAALNAYTNASTPTPAPGAFRQSDRD